MDIPRQEKQETVPAFVLRACSIMEKTHKSGEGVKTSARLAEEAETKRERIERLESKYSECDKRSLSRTVIVVLSEEKQFSIVLCRLFFVRVIRFPSCDFDYCLTLTPSIDATQ